MKEKENILRCYRHLLPDHLPDLSQGHQMILPAGFNEVPPYEQGGLDWFGVLWRTETPAAIPDPMAPRVLTDISKWREQVKFPDLDLWDWDNAVIVDKVDVFDRENKLMEVLIKEGPFERIHALMGMQEALTALLTDQEEFIALASAITDFKCQLINKVAQYYKPDIINFHDDYGTQKSMMLSPVLWRRIFKPLIQKVVAVCHSHGIFFDLHSCGLIEPIIPELAEIGVDCLNCMPINDIPKMKELTSDKLTFFVGFDVQKYELCDRTGQLTGDIRNEIRETIAAWGKNGNYLPSNRLSEWWVSKVIAEELENMRWTMYPAL
ncbi:MAG: hypothetical protein GXY05_02040 [Clostridiales bacterium]|nr:hypothetical protein [Clostridiales bacterium]